MPGFDQEPDKLHGLVTGYAPGYTENNAFTFVDLRHSDKLTDPVDRRKLLETCKVHR
jgi:hypothetical protein